MLSTPRAAAVARCRIGCSTVCLPPSRASLPLATIGLFAVRNAASTSSWPFPNGAFAPAYATGPGHGPPPYLHAQVRGKRTKTTVNFDDLPQGPIKSLEPLPPEENGPAYPTVVLQARRNMQKFSNCVLLTRVGGFYELYFEQAEEYGPLLNLKVAQKKTNAGPVPMAGFPFFQLDRFLKVLVQDLNRYVAVAEEFPNDPSEKVKSGGLMHDRRVSRIITPGTLIDENFMDPYANNYVMAIHLCEAESASGPVGRQENPHAAPDNPDNPDNPATASGPLGLAWLDLSTGSFFTQSATMVSLTSILSRLSPREVILDEVLESRRGHELFTVLAEDKHLITYAPQGQFQGLSDWAPMLESEIPSDTLDAFTKGEVKAGSLLLHYVKDRLQGSSLKLQPPVRHESRQIMAIDKNSMRSLEIKQTIRDSTFRGSLLHAIRRTVTRSGARLLNEWISSPSTSLEVIAARHNLVSRFIQDEHLRDGIVLLLRRTNDSQRLVQKFALNRGDADDLLRLASTIKATEDIVTLIKSRLHAALEPRERDSLAALLDRINLEQPMQLWQRIHDAIDEEGLFQQHQVEDSEAGEMLALAQAVVDAEGKEEDNSVLPKTARKRKAPSIREHYGEDNEAWIMKPQASPRLQRLHDELARLLENRVALTESLRSSFKATSLTLRWTPSLGHICHVKGKDARSSRGGGGDTTPAIKTLSSSRTTRSFHHPEWSALGERLDKVRFQIRQEEKQVFNSLREAVVLNLVKLRRNAAVLDELDITTSFARLALELGLTRPTLVDSTPAPSSSPSTAPTPAAIIISGRHPTVEAGLTVQGRTFTPNDLILGGSSPSPAAPHARIWLITGPNMAGKSTFLRQNALIAVLAQAGCFVPAAHATLGVVDAIFSRVGSADDLSADQSTFMVEMLETAAILRQATARSLVVMDEVGRGTTPDDGAAVAFAALSHLVRVNRCRGLFATHFHVVADLAERAGMMMGDGVERAGGDAAVEAYCTDVEEDADGRFAYVHKLRKGVNRRSHALKVARLAGLPEEAIRVAQEVLEGFESAYEKDGREGENLRKAKREVAV